MQPIKALTQGAQRIAAGDFEHSIVAETGDEMQTLAQQFNTMARDLKELYTDLEQKVEARTDTLLQQTRDLAVLEERNRMAREIHDTLAQGFTGIFLQLEAAEQAWDESPPEVPDHLGRAKNLAKESLQEARRSVWNLVPRALEQLPVSDALRDEVEQFNSAHPEKAHFSVSGEKRELPSDVQTVLLRISQESLR